MTKKSTASVAICVFLIYVPPLLAQDKTPPEKAPATATAAPATPNAQNLDAYIKLLRTDVRSQKYAVMSGIMQLAHVIAISKS